LTGNRHVIRLASWNVNSLRARQERVLEWMEYAQPDVLCLQETKLAETAWDASAFEAMGYQSVHHGQGQWNGVAIISRLGLESVATGFPDELLSEFPVVVPETSSSESTASLADDRVDSPGEPEATVARVLREARLILARCGPISVASVYVPNGRALDHPHYQAKLVWLDLLRRYLAAGLERGDPLVVAGDFNIAPEDRDVYSPSAWLGSTHVSELERAALARLADSGLVDVFRLIHAEAGLYSWWDYRGGSFNLGKGLRIDLVLASKSLADRAVWTVVDREARKIRHGKAPSDHAPVVVDFDMGGG
jgi:exodeoxyribonuclease-3